MNRETRKDFYVEYYSHRSDGVRTLTHQYYEVWGKEELFCPKCGQSHVWRRYGGGDYYVGDQYICTACRGSFYMPSGVQNLDSEQDEQRFLALNN